MQRKIVASIALLALAALSPATASDACTAPAAAGGEWPMYGHDHRNTRTQTAEQTIGPDEARTLAPAWSFSARDAGGAGDFTGTPVVAGGCVFVASNQGWAFAIDATTGARVWATQLTSGGTVNSSVAVSGDSVYAFVSRVGAPYVVALDRSTGAIRWETTVDEQEGADAFASPAVFRGVVWVGVSGDAAQHDDASVRTGFIGSIVALDAEDGTILEKIWTIPEAQWDEGYAGATISAPPAFDEATGYAYAGTASAYVPQHEHPHANALLKIDADPTRATFGDIVAAYKGDTFDAVVPGYSSMPCEDLPIPPPPAIVPTGRGIGACGDVDVDFAQSPNLFEVDGELRVGAVQKSGAYHAAAAEDLAGSWRTTWGPAQPFGGVATAYDGARIYGGGAPPGHLWALDPADGSIEWTAAIGDGAHYGIPVAVANGVVYTLDVRGFLDAYDAETGIPLLHRPIALGASTGADPVLTFGGVSVAANTVFASVGFQNTGLDFAGVSNGYVVAFRPTTLP